MSMVSLETNPATCWSVSGRTPERGLRPRERVVEGMPREDVDERQEGRHHGLEHEIAEADDRLGSLDAGEAADHREPEDEAGGQDGSVEQAAGHRTRGLGTHEWGGHRSDRHGGHDRDGHRRPLELGEDGVDDGRPGEVSQARRREGRAPASAPPPA